MSKALNIVRKVVEIVFCKGIHRVEYRNIELLDKNETYLFMANHVSWADPVFLVAKIPNLNTMAKSELFEYPLLKPILKFANAFPVYRGKKDFKSLLHSVNILTKKKESLLIFPEGTRRAKEKGERARNGATVIAVLSGVKIVPIHITEKFGFFSKVVCTFGEPQNIQLAKEDISNKELLTLETNRIMKIIYDMKEE